MAGAVRTKRSIACPTWIVHRVAIFTGFIVHQVVHTDPTLIQMRLRLFTAVDL